MRREIVACCLALAAIPALADKLQLKNGDQLTGTIVKSDGKTLVLKTDYAGDLTIEFNAIQSITSTGELTVAAGGKSAAGSVTTSGDRLVVATNADGTFEAPMASVTTLRSPAEEAAYQKSLHPGWSEGWTGSANVGFALTRGNSETKNLNIGFSAARKGFHDKLMLYTDSVYATNDLSTASPHTTANTIGGGARYDHDFAARGFEFVSGDFFSNALQQLDLRAILGGGLGVHAIKSAVTTLDLLLGANYTHESYAPFTLPPVPPATTGTLVAAETNSLAGLTVGDAFTRKVAKGTSLTQNLFFYPDLSNTGQYRFTCNIGTVTKLSKWLGWQNSFDDIYVSAPPEGTKKNDLQLTTGLNISFTH
jgi:putative salt-induced outer membrane protein YdiY